MSTKPKHIRYCSECGTIGAVPADKQDCCPTANPSFVSHDIALQAHAGFKAALALHEAKRTITAANTVGLSVVDTE